MNAQQNSRKTVSQDVGNTRRKGQYNIAALPNLDITYLMEEVFLAISCPGNMVSLSCVYNWHEVTCINMTLSVGFIRGQTFKSSYVLATVEFVFL
jgi:hypothetical protein